MQVFTRTISSVFGSERRYTIPLFQRPYVWTKEYQWEPLWDDIIEKATDELANQPVETPPHFLGAIVIQQQKSWGDALLTHDVIDGQQRLTTFQILLSAFRDIANERGEKQIASWLGSLTRNANAIANPDVEQFKVWPTSRDVDHFRLVITAGGRAAVEKVHPAIKKRGSRWLLPRPRMVEAYLYFYEAIEQWLQEEDKAGVTNRCKALRRVLDRQFQLVSIELDGQEDPQAIFETLNARGVPLLASDLLRNYIFQRAGNPTEAARLHSAYWARFEIPDSSSAPDGLRFWEAEERQGRLNRARLDLFIQHYLVMKRGREIFGGRLYPEYKDWIEKSKPFVGLEEELKDLTGFADHFYRLLRPDEGSPFGRFAARLRVLDTSTIYPLVLWLLGLQSLDEKERSGIFRDLESFLVRRLVCGRPSKSYTRLFAQLLRDFEAKKVFTRAAFHELLAAGKGESVDWPNDADFERAWLTIDAYRVLKPSVVEMMLREIEVGLHSPKAEKVTVHGSLTVEHVLPQEWRDFWPLPAGIDPEVSEEKREEVLHDFGNLTLLTSGLNAAVSNGPAARKLPEIAKESLLKLNQYFSSKTSWTEQDIRDRSAALFEVAKRVWPSP